MTCCGTSQIKPRTAQKPGELKAYTLISNFVFQVKKLNEYKAEISSLNKQISSTKKQIEELKKIENGNTSEDLETIARNRLNMVKPNEIVYIDIGKEGK